MPLKIFKIMNYLKNRGGMVGVGGEMGEDMGGEIEWGGLLR